MYGQGIGLIISPSEKLSCLSRRCIFVRGHIPFCRGMHGLYLRHVAIGKATSGSFHNQRFNNLFDLLFLFILCKEKSISLSLPDLVTKGNEDVLCPENTGKVDYA